MNSLLLSLALVLASSFLFIGCTPRQAADQGEVEGIPSTGYNRDRIYEWQDQTFRRLAY